ncbi:adenosine deaminase [Enterococcus cecorum]|uniref:adenosine deaminase n=1 Tax=Enterococcus cecorum TaxID=44008 RepID=UPI00148E8304|nr:adenosine deaminase [Enterococcus cecorum]
MEKALLQRVPKVELHCHLDGSISMACLEKMAKKDGYPLENLAKVHAPKKCQNLQAYLDSFDAVLPLLQSEENLTMAAYDLVEQVSRENVRYLEIRFAPLLHTHQGLSVSQILDAVCLGIEQGMQDYEVEVNLIISAMRHHSNERNLDLVEKVCSMQQARVVGFDYAGDERDDLGERGEVVALAKNKQLQITLHAGECGCAHHVVEAIHLGATRIGHGVAIKDDLKALDLCVQKGTLLEICPTSNLQTNAVDTIENYPYPLFVEKKVKFCVNTDNRTVSNTSLINEYALLNQYFGFDLSMMQKTNIDAIQASFAHPTTKERICRELKQKYQELMHENN